MSARPPKKPSPVTKYTLKQWQAAAGGFVSTLTTPYSTPGRVERRMAKAQAGGRGRWTRRLPGVRRSVVGS